MNTEQSDEFAIQTNRLTCVFDKFRAVDGLSLNVRAGTMYGFLGRNGAGKSTTIKMLTGILKPTAGEICLLGNQVEDTDTVIPLRRRIGVVPENLPLFDLLNGHENLLFIGRMYLLDEETLDDRVDELLKVLQVNAEPGQLVADYSHGMRKKLALAAALLPNPDLLFLDEPFEGVDAVASRIMKDILRDYVNRGSTIFLTSHVLDIVEGLCSHVGIIHNGRLVFEEEMSQLKEKSLEDVFIELVGSVEEMRVELEWLTNPSPTQANP